MSTCSWCGRDNTTGGHARCSAERRRARRLRATLARVAWDSEPTLRLTAAFFDDLRLHMALGDTGTRAFVKGEAGQFRAWCDLLSVPDEGAVRSHLLARWAERAKRPRKARPWKPCVHCGEADVTKFRKRKDGYRSVCRECENRADRQRRASRRAT